MARGGGGGRGQRHVPDGPGRGWRVRGPRRAGAAAARRVPARVRGHDPPRASRAPAAGEPVLPELAERSRLTAGGAMLRVPSATPVLQESLTSIRTESVQNPVRPIM